MHLSAKTALTRALVLCGFLLLCTVTTRAQPRANQVVAVAGGGVTSSSTGTSAFLTVGQPVMGVTSSARLGFQYLVTRPTGTAIEPPGEGLPSVHRLHQNYPNPFNPSTTVVFDLPAPEHVRIDVFDLLGRLQQRVLDATRTAGTHEVIVDASSLPSGVYLYRLSAADRTITRRMVLLR